MCIRDRCSRGIVAKEQVDLYLSPTRKDFYNPFLMPDMQKAVDRIINAIKNKEKVIIYGDYDVDGITSTTVLKQFLAERGLIVDWYIPNRLNAVSYTHLIEYLEAMERLNLEIASEFLVMASTLIYLKSKILLPKEVEEEKELTEEELLMRIIEYKKYKEITKKMKEMYEARCV